MQLLLFIFSYSLSLAGEQEHQLFQISAGGKRCTSGLQGGCVIRALGGKRWQGVCTVSPSKAPVTHTAAALPELQWDEPSSEHMLSLQLPQWVFVQTVKERIQTLSHSKLATPLPYRNVKNSTFTFKEKDSFAWTKQKPPSRPPFTLSSCQQCLRSYCNYKCTPPSREAVLQHNLGIV